MEDLMAAIWELQAITNAIRVKKEEMKTPLPTVLLLLGHVFITLINVC
jgi:hypothetical protein